MEWVENSFNRLTRHLRTDMPCRCLPFLPVAKCLQETLVLETAAVSILFCWKFLSVC